MTVKCELTNFAKNGSPVDNPKVIIEDNGSLSEQVKITIGKEHAKVRADELAKALNACTGIPF